MKRFGALFFLKREGRGNRGLLNEIVRVIQGSGYLCLYVKLLMIEKEEELLFPFSVIDPPPSKRETPGNAQKP